MEKKNNTAKIFRGFSAIRRVSAGRGSRSTRALLDNERASRSTRALLDNECASRQRARLQLQIPREVAQNRGFKREPRERLHKIAVSSANPRERLHKIVASVANPARGCAKARLRARTPREVAQNRGFKRESRVRLRKSGRTADGIEKSLKVSQFEIQHGSFA